MQDCVAVVAGNLRQLREQRVLTLGGLAERSGVAKGTISALERGHGNPTIETLFALAYALDVTLADLVEEPKPPETAVIRAGDRPMIEGLPLDGRLLRRSRHEETTVEVYELLLHPGADHHAKAHRPGTRECMYVIEGEVETGPHDDPVRLGPGDFASFPADVPHDYRSHGVARALLIMTVPKRSPAR